jgi:hypothetical protein
LAVCSPLLIQKLEYIVCVYQVAVCGVPIVSHDQVIYAIDVKQSISASYGSVVSGNTLDGPIQPDLISVYGGVFSDGGHHGHLASILKG